jgi:hypothetical protein
MKSPTYQPCNLIHLSYAISYLSAMQSPTSQPCSLLPVIHVISYLSAMQSPTLSAIQSPTSQPCNLLPLIHAISYLSHASFSPNSIIIFPTLPTAPPPPRPPYFSFSPYLFLLRSPTAPSPPPRTFYPENCVIFFPFLVYITSNRIFSREPEEQIVTDRYFFFSHKRRSQL